MKKNIDINQIYDIASQRIKMFRKYRGLTQEQLSMNSTFSRGFIANLERSKTHQTLSLGVQYYIAETLEIPIELFVKENIDEELKKININQK